eukprot:5906498-Prymnesium_polylepis.5
MSKITPQPSNYLFKQISIGPAPNILNEDKDTYTSFTTLDQLKRIDRKVKKGCMSITSDTDDTKSSVADEEIKESDLGEDVAYEDDPGEDDMEFNDDNDYNDDNDSKSTKSDTISETKSVKSVTKIGKETVKKPRAKKKENIELKKEEIDDNW